MKGKILVLLLVFVFLFSSGCSGKDTGPVTDESNTPAPEAGVTEQEENVPLGAGEEHIVRLEYYKVIRPSELDVQAGDTVSWWSGKRQGTYVLVSEEGLFSDQEMAYSVPYSYTFNTPGTYLFTIKDTPEMNVTIRVN
ncbi:hypothetical protein EO95_10235 [Methanosarcina sp. 1.H.T.1A.1]|uniref:cell surface lipoprotein n=1 Tax=unclassified Methanosarcina TaxID=2644672 RepID=UPI000620F42B|nr:MULTISPECIES: cell surface lipoprotein [unclassified Methanosarcina]KKH49170.1 hypothetical protein EO93_09775 [Methanosarcina sp. 1.H.A.2.2]KKH96410.1 hypothetical protein EO95_10235 [Methanosarcina sp. 1.H.T.1A.1]